MRAKQDDGSKRGKKDGGLTRVKRVSEQKEDRGSRRRKCKRGLIGVEERKNRKRALYSSSFKAHLSWK